MTSSPGAPHPQHPVRILLVDDQELLRGAFQVLLDAQEDLEVVASAAEGAAALEALRARPGAVDLVLLDLRMPVLDGLGVLRAMRADGGLAGVPVLVLTTFDEEDLILGALRAGARGFLLKDASPAVLLQAARAVAAGGSWLDPAVTGTVLAHLGDGVSSVPAPSTPRGPSSDSGAAPDVPGPTTDSTSHLEVRPAAAPLPEPLTDREREVLDLVCEGLSNLEIGERLFLAESTVKTHVKAVLGKTGCRNRVELIVHAYRTGLVAV